MITTNSTTNQNNGTVVGGANPAPPQEMWIPSVVGGINPAPPQDMWIPSVCGGANPAPPQGWVEIALRTVVC